MTAKNPARKHGALCAREQRERTAIVVYTARRVSGDTFARSMRAAVDCSGLGTIGTHHAISTSAFRKREVADRIAAEA